MKIGIIGRHPHIMETALATAGHVGHEAIGTLEDAVALQWISQRQIGALVIGGGVEAASRQILLQACAAQGIQPVEIMGPGQLESALRAL